MFFADESAYGMDVGEESVEFLFFDDADEWYVHLGELLDDFLRYHRAADDEVGFAGEDFFDVEVADAADAFDVLCLWRIVAEVGSSDEEAVGAEGEDYLGYCGREAYDALGVGGYVDDAAVVVGVLVGGVCGLVVGGVWGVAG